MLPPAKEGPRVLNLGSGDNPLPGATNVDIRQLPGVDVVTKPGAPLPFGKGQIDEVVVINPAKVEGSTFDPLGLSAPVLKPGGKIYIVGQDNNYLLNQIKNMSDADLAKLGYKRVTPEGIAPKAEDRFKFGDPKTISGFPINPKSYRQVILERIGE